MVARSGPADQQDAVTVPHDAVHRDRSPESIRSHDDHRTHDREGFALRGSSSHGERWPSRLTRLLVTLSTQVSHRQEPRTTGERSPRDEPHDQPNTGPFGSERAARKEVVGEEGPIERANPDDDESQTDDDVAE